ncbi:GyrI-like domain-containing protein [Bdellovibrio bacteriovorus]|uniref:GyrI-like domain-containing protein n=1 Tax=Bdellovibrio bacteriovorus TaxID=959 RepID=UPI0021CEF253|nr:GyrI-like domain-containing protein [Bdellovibrio bacteriovorus]UXR66130.1 GyrI-like domain-containing protein [Bdellovibrio bacteriovorus]
MKYVLVFVLVTMISFGLFLANYLGAFRGVEISEVTQGPFKTVFVEHVGPYHKVNKQLERIEKYMKSQGITCGRTFGEYLDNPREVEEARLRSKVGCILEGEPPQLTEGLQVGEIPQRKYVMAVFTGSPGIGPLKVYPKVNDFMLKAHLKQTGAVIEIYEIHSITEKNAMTTTYLFPVQ